jgi:hypothetical protein
MDESTLIDLAANTGAVGAVAIVFLLWLRQRVATGKLIIISTTAKALLDREAKALAERDDAIRERDAKTRCAEHQTELATQARERLISVLESSQRIHTRDLESPGEP